MTILDTLRQLYDDRGEEIESWFMNHRLQSSPMFYTSVDLRHSGLRLAPVDTNLYPAGFNNLSLAARSRSARYMANYLSDHHPAVKRLLIVPEKHTRNTAYLENLAVLTDILGEAGFEVRIGSLQLAEEISLETMTGRHITQSPLKREADRLLLVDGYDADVIILNNDMTGGEEPMLHNLAQPVLPPMEMGWYRRRKSVHFEQYQKLVRDFGQTFDFDPWLLCANFHRCGLVDFKQHTNIEKLALYIDGVLAHMARKYEQYGVNDTPYVFVKADSGTYGMGIMTMTSGEQVLELNKKERNKMQVIKEGMRNSEVIIQEGIPTIDAVEGSPAEPMVYMVDGIPVGGMYRVNASRDMTNNLNASGMEFVGMCDEAETSDIARMSVKECDFRAYGLVAAIAALAVPRENYDSYMINL